MRQQKFRIGHNQSVKLWIMTLSCIFFMWIFSPIVGHAAQLPSIIMDRYLLKTEALGELIVHKDRTLIPLRFFLDQLGATITWDNDTRKITASLRDTLVTMQIDSVFASVNGEEKIMDIAPMIHHDKTYIPLRYIAEFFEEHVGWEAGNGDIYIGPLGRNQNWELELYLQALDLNKIIGSYYVNASSKEALQFQMVRRAREVAVAKEDLFLSWNIETKEDVLEMVNWLYNEGHSASYEEILADLEKNNLTRQNLIAIKEVEPAEAPWVDFYLSILDIEAKWGDIGILAWDMCRVAQVTRLAFIGGLISYEAFLDLTLPAAKKVQENFSGWEEMDQNFVHGALLYTGSSFAEPNEHLSGIINAHQRISEMILPPWDFELEIQPWETK